MATVKLKGLDKVLSNLNVQIKKTKGATMAGLWDAGLQIQGAAQKRVPIDLGNLRGSAYTRAAGGKMARLQKAPDSSIASDPSGAVAESTVEIGFTAYYAAFVHENLEARHTVGEAKFLEHAITDNQAAILEIIKRRAQVRA